MPAFTHEDLDAETDARFWAQSGVKPGHKLDPHDPVDAHWIPVWKKIFAKVAAEAKAGTLKLTYKNPAVAQGIAVAKQAADAIASTLEPLVHAAAPNVPDPWDVPDVQTAKAASNAALAHAASHQPPTIDPAAVATAAKAQLEATGAAHRVPEALGPLAPFVPPSPPAPVTVAPAMNGSDQVAMKQAIDAPKKALETYANSVTDKPPPMTFAEWLKHGGWGIALAGVLGVGAAYVLSSRRAPQTRTRTRVVALARR